MSAYKEYFGNSASVILEIEGDDDAISSGGSFADSLQVIREIATTAIDEFNKLPTEKIPDEINLTCGLKALEDGKLVVTSGSGEANFVINLKWNEVAGSGDEDGSDFDLQP